MHNRMRQFLGWKSRAAAYCQLIRDVNREKRLYIARRCYEALKTSSGRLRRQYNQKVTAAVERREEHQAWNHELNIQ